MRELIAERNAVIVRCEKLEHLLRVARNAQYGRSSEKLNQDQLELALEDVERAIAKTREAYLADVLEKLVNGWPAARIGKLLPWAYANPRPYKWKAEGAAILEKIKRARAALNKAQAA